MSTTFTRRNLLQVTGLAALAGIAGVTLSSCAPGGGAVTGGAVIGSSGLRLPTYRDSAVVEPALVSAHDGGMAAYLEYPAKAVQAVSKTPLAGSTVTAITYSFDPVAPGVNDNVIWQQVNEALGGNLEIVYTPFGDYTQKFATTIAGGALPDLVAIRPPVQQLPALLNAKFTDLTEHLSGDAVLDYPNLAGLPTISWQETVINDRIWGVPMSRPPVGPPLIVRKDLFEEYSLSTSPKDFDEFKEIVVALTNDREGRWALGDFVGTHDLLRSTHGIPGPWIEKKGAFTADYELPEYEQSLADVRELVELGVMHPDMVGSSNTQRNDWFLNGSAPMAAVGFTGLSKFATWGKDIPNFAIEGMLPFSYDGKVEPTHLSAGVTPHFMAITKTDEKRVKELLRVLDWLAAPFGSTEYELRNFGIEGQTFDFVDGTPQVNSQGQSLKLVPFKYLTDAPQVIFNPVDPADGERQFEYQEQALELQGGDPTAGLYSEADATKSTQLTTKAGEARADIVLGRKPVSSWKEFVAYWKANGGDQIRKEYEKAFEKANS
ncbi:extracellular solute-binding protein [Microbacterium sp. DT81.1]|uniref:extracellular solute-binding protein n=1 Tax=Microbacterium sp. DT81.1 TaxID=3393413 RepID=UPI003CECECAF